MSKRILALLMSLAMVTVVLLFLFKFALKPYVIICSFVGSCYLGAKLGTLAIKLSRKIYNIQ